MSGVFPAPYPVFLDLVGKRALVVGAGPVAARKVAGLLRAGAHVTVVAPDAVPEIAEDPDVRWHERPYRRGEVASYAVAITATSDPAVNRQVARDGNAANVWVNSADDPENCGFILPSVVRRGDLQVAVSTNGRSPAMAQWARRRLETLFTDTHGAALDVLAEVRAEVRQASGTSEVDGWTDAVDDRFFDLIGAGDVDAARDHVRSALGLTRRPDTHVDTQHQEVPS
ncbi:MAG: bifunctional precorrin-2 dehydrogenase/sirohydrochlorin ferrochelatase [Ilumatobacter sp.]|nr:bifunctional precorrin-2 dehydrogenase/sirohydrochlorin ferrochelatase [Ilumatobacter sp.]